MPYRPGDPDAGMDGRYGAMDRADFLDQLEEQFAAPSSREAQMARILGLIASERSRLGDGLNPTAQPADGEVGLRFMPYQPADGDVERAPMPYRPGDPDAGMDGRYRSVGRADFLDQLEEQFAAPPSREAQMARILGLIASERSRLGDGLNPTAQPADGDVSLKSMPYQPADGDVERAPMPYRPGDPDAGMDGRYRSVGRADFLDQLEEQFAAPSSREAQMARILGLIASERSRLGDGLNPTAQPVDGEVELTPMEQARDVSVDDLNLVDMSGSSIQAQVAHHNSVSERVQTLVEVHNTQIESFHQRMDQYERDVAAFNGATGVRDTKERERLVAERGALEQLGSEINGRGETVRQAAEWVTANAGQINDGIEVANLDFNKHFWDVRYRGKDWGMHTASDGREIALPDEYKKYYNDYVALQIDGWRNDYVQGLRQLQGAGQFTNENVAKLHDLLSEHRDAGHSASEWKFAFVDGEFEGTQRDNDGPGRGSSDVSYTVNDDGTVKMEQDGHTYTIRDEERAEAIRNAPTIDDVTEIDQNTPDGGYLTTDGQMVQVSNQDNGLQTISTHGSGEVTVMDDARYFQRDVAELRAAGQVAVSPEEIDRLSNLGRDLTLEWGDTPFAENASAAVSAYVGIPTSTPAGVEAGRRQGFDQGLALTELQADLQRVAEGKTSLPAVLAKWEADPRSATLMLEGPRERLYGEEVGEYEGPPTEISATEWLSQAVTEETAQFENTFRQVTGRAPSGNRARDAAVLSQYGENPLTDMGYAAEVQAFENIFRQVTGREPSGDLAQDADILSRYGENAVTDMGYAGEVQAFEKTFRDVTGREPSGDLARDADILSRYGENAVTDMGYAGEVRAFEKTFRDVTGREPSGDLARDADILSRYGENAVTDMGYAAEVRERQERERRVAHLEGKFRDEVLQIGEAPGGFVENVLDSQIEGGGLPTNHPDFPEYDQLRTEMDGPNWRREQIASATQQLLDDSTIWTIDIGPAKDAVSALVTGRHVSNYDSSIPVPINAGVLPVIGTLADANIRGADGYSRGDVAWLAGMGALDVLPIPGVGTLARTSKGAMVVIRNLPAAGEIATGGRRTLASVTQGTLKAPYQLTGARPKPQGVSNIPVHMGGEVVVDGQLVPAWEGLLRQRDEALQQYRQTGMPQSIDLPTADGGIQTVWVGGSRAATSYGTGGMVHTSPMAGLLTELSQTPEGFVGKVKVGKSGQLLPDVEQRHFMTTQGVPAFREGSAFNKTLYEDPNFSPGYQTFVDPRNLADVEHVRKVFGGDVDTGVMRPSAVVELEGGVPQSKVIAGGPDKPPLYQEYPVGLQKTRGITEHMYVDVPPDLQVGRLEVFRDNVLAEVDRLRGRTETFYVAHQNADGTIEVLRKADMAALAAEGVSLDDALRVRTRAGETRFIAPSQWDSAVRRFSTAAARGNDERHDFKNAQDRGLDNRDTFGAGVRTPNGNPPVGSVDVVGRPDGRYALGGDGPLRISAPAPTARLSGPLPGTARPTPSPIPMVEPQPDARVPDPRIPDAHVPDARVPDPRIPDARVPDPLIPDPRIPDPRIPDPRIPDPRTPDLTRQRRVRLPEVDEAPMTVVKAEEGLYPRVVAHDELIRVYHDLDTGEVRTEPLVLPTEPIIVKHDDTPPPIESRFAGHRRITPRGGYVFTKPVGERRRKASSKRHPYLRKGELRRR